MKPITIALVALVSAGFLAACSRDAAVTKSSHSINPDINWGIRGYR